MAPPTDIVENLDEVGDRVGSFYVAAETVRSLSTGGAGGLIGSIS